MSRKGVIFSNLLNRILYQDYNISARYQKIIFGYFACF